MQRLRTAVIAGLAPFVIGLSINADAGDDFRPRGHFMLAASTTDTTDTTDTTADSYTLDEHEATHLIFMREEEKLARDVYLTLADMYPRKRVFSQIANAEQTHTDAVRDMLAKYGLPDPSTSNDVGVFTGPDYGWYFTEKYYQLVQRGMTSELDALYVGAFIEELDMVDIQQCPNVIVESGNEVGDISQCAAVYTDNPDLQQLYANLIDGSKNHLRAFVANIEKIIGEGNYQAQVISQEEVDAILGR